ncbi:MAG: site-specific integrase, partial [Pseudomonadota bacterium]
MQIELEKIEPLNRRDIKDSSLEGLTASAKDIIRSSLSPATLKAYKAAWKIFSKFCTDHNRTALGCDVQTLILFLTDQIERGKAPQTLQKHIAAIKYVHDLQGYHVD